MELKFPDGFKADDNVVKDFKAVAKELGLKSESAQKIADLFIKTEQASQEAWKSETAAWAESAKTDKEYGGAKFDESLKTALKAADRFASPELRKLLDTSRLGNHPEVLRLFVQVGRAMAEDSVAGATGATSSTDPKEALQRQMYPSAFQK